MILPRKKLLSKCGANEKAIPKWDDKSEFFKHIFLSSFVLSTLGGKEEISFLKKITFEQLTILFSPFKKGIHFEVHRTVGVPYFMSLSTLISTRLTILFPQPWNELLWWDHADLLLLRGNAVEKVCQAGQQVFLLFLLGLVCQHILTERPAEIQGLKHGVTVACVPKLPKDKQGWFDHALGTCHLCNRWRKEKGHPPWTSLDSPVPQSCLPCQKSKHQQLADQQGNEHKFT